MRSWTVAIASTVLVVHGVAAAQSPPQVSAERDLIKVAGAGSVGDFARVLARARVPAGFIVSQAELRRVVLPQSQSLLTPLRTQVDEAMRVFGQRHPGFAVSRENGATLIARPSTPCRPALQQEMTDLEMVGPLYAAGTVLLHHLNPTVPNIPGGVVGSRLGAAPLPGSPPVAQPEPAPSLVHRQVSLLFQRLTLKEALDEIVRQVPGLVWVLVDRPSPVDDLPGCVLKWIGPNNDVTTSYDFLQLRR